MRADYLEQLGMPSWLLQQNNNQQQISTIKQEKYKCLVVEKQCSESFLVDGASKDLLFKMLTALDLDEDDVKCISINDEVELKEQLSGLTTDNILLMGDFKVNKNAFITPHPSEMLKNTELKKVAWNEIKGLKNA